MESMEYRQSSRKAWRSKNSEEEEKGGNESYSNHAIQNETYIPRPPSTVYMTTLLGRFRLNEPMASRQRHVKSGPNSF